MTTARRLHANRSQYLPEAMRRHIEHQADDAADAIGAHDHRSSLPPRFPLGGDRHGIQQEPAANAKVCLATMNNVFRISGVAAAVQSHGGATGKKSEHCT